MVFFLTESRLLMGYDDIQETAQTKSYSILLRPLKASKKADAQILRVRGRPNDDWGSVQLAGAKNIEPLQALVMVQHPAGITKQFNAVRCAIHASQTSDFFPELLHTCDTAAGSSGSLLLRESDLAIVGLHYGGGLRALDRKTFNRAKDFNFVSQQLQLSLKGVSEIQPTAGISAIALRLSEIESSLAKAEKERQLAAKRQERNRVAQELLSNAGADEEKLRYLIHNYPRTAAAAAARVVMGMAVKKINDNGDGLTLAPVVLKEKVNTNKALPNDPIIAIKSVVTLAGGRELFLRVQMNLQRLGCSPGRPDGVWGRKSRKAMVRYNKHAGAQLNAVEPGAEALAELDSKTGKICPIVCNRKQKIKNGRCVSKTCPKGSKLSNGGNCIKLKTRIVKSDAGGTAKTNSKPKKQSEQCRRLKVKIDDPSYFEYDQRLAIKKYSQLNCK